MHTCRKSNVLSCISSLQQTCENLEAKNLEVNRHADDMSVQLEMERRKNRRLLDEKKEQRVKIPPQTLNFSKSFEAQPDDVSVVKLEVKGCNIFPCCRPQC